MPTKNIDLPGLIEQFGCEDKCREYLEELRWPNGVTCPRCWKAGRRADRISRIKKRHQFHCDECSYQFSVRAGTILQDSKLPLWKWFLAIYMMVESKKGVSANQIKRMVGVSYKTAWFLCHRIREAMREDNPAWLSGTVELDETFVGGVARGNPKGDAKNWDNKTVVLAAVERGGKTRLRAVKDRKGKTLKDFVDDVVRDDAKAIYTDANPAYNEAVGDADHKHRTVTHRNNEWVHGKIHTNTVEGVFSLLDRAIMGSYHKVSKKHLPAYLNEVEWRYNNRKNPYLFRDTWLNLLAGDPLEYKKLTA